MSADGPRRKLRGGSIDHAWEVEVRQKIQASQIANRLISFVNGEIKLEKSQVTAALGLLRKVLPDLSSAEIKSEHTHRYVARVPEKVADSTVWQQKHSPEATQH